MIGMSLVVRMEGALMPLRAPAKRGASPFRDFVTVARSAPCGAGDEAGLKVLPPLTRIASHSASAATGREMMDRGDFHAFVTQRLRRPLRTSSPSNPYLMVTLA